MRFAIKHFVSFFKLLRIIDYQTLRIVLGDALVIFDKDYYRSHPGLFRKIVPRTHYVILGIIKHENPNRFFDSSQYQRNLNPKSLGWYLPLMHYLYHGIFNKSLTDWDALYLIMRPDVSSFGRSCMSHYFRHGIFELQPNAFQDLVEANRMIPSAAHVTSKLQFNYFSHQVCKLPDYNLSVEMNISTPAKLHLRDSRRHLQKNHLMFSYTVDYHQDLNCCPITPLVEVQLIDSKVELFIHSSKRLILDLAFLEEVILSASLSSIIDEGFFDLEYINGRITNYLQRLDLYFFQDAFLTDKYEIFESYSHKKSQQGFIIELDQKFHLESLPKALNILCISHEDSRTGASIYLAQFSQFLEREGHQVQIVSLQENLNDGVFDENELSHCLLKDLPPNDVPINKVLKNWKLTELGSRKLKRLISTGNFDLVIVNSLASSDAIRIIRGFDIRVLLYVHENSMVSKSFRISSALTEEIKLAFCSADLVVFSSNSARKNWGLDQRSGHSTVTPSYRKVIQLSNEERNRIRQTLRKLLGISQESFVFLAISSFETRKRVTDVIDAFVALGKEHTTLLLVGESYSSLSKVETEIRKRIQGHTNIIIVKQQAEPTPYYVASDCFIIASDEEVMPMTIQEAAANHLPRIVSNFDGHDEIVTPNISALVFTIGDIQSLQSKMNQIHTNSRLGKSLADSGNEEYNRNLNTFEDSLRHIISATYLSTATFIPKEYQE